LSVLRAADEMRRERGTASAPRFAEAVPEISRFRHCFNLTNLSFTHSGAKCELSRLQTRIGTTGTAWKPKRTAIWI